MENEADILAKLFSSWGNTPAPGIGILLEERPQE